MKQIDKDKYSVEEYRKGSEKRYRIVDSKRKVFDDAQGYGYKSSQNAMKALYYKINKGEIESRNAEFRKILDRIKPQLKEFEWILEDVSYLKDGDYKYDIFEEFWNAVIEKYPELSEYRTKSFTNYLKNNIW